MILDGWGKSPNPEVSAIDKANTPFIDQLYTKYPNSNLRTDGLHVGLPDGQMGNSEVGHMNLGAGRIVYQDLVKINLAIQNHELEKETVLQDAFTYAKENQKKVHFLGLLSDGGVHSHINHLKGLIDAATQADVQQSYIHAFTDGRDVDPKSGISYIDAIQKHIVNTNTKLATVVGRYFAMDRDKRWERVSEAYQLLVHAKGQPTTDILKSMQDSYNRGVTDEFIEPIVVDQQGAIEPEDVVVFFNFRTDRGRQLTQALSQEEFLDFNMKKLPLYYLTMTNYDEAFQGVHVIYNKDNLEDTLGSILEKNGKTQIRIAETEKYPHVTFFFNGGREEPFEGEKRILCPSPKVATYDLQPEMSAWEITNAIIPELEAESTDFICLNFANPDMVGHTGSMEAAIKACETVDQCAEKVITTALKHGYTTLVIADHGNCDTMKNPDGSVNTAHTTNPVPLIVVDRDIKQVADGILGDIAPTILEIMEIQQPAAMTQSSLL